jgi:hypothetical protein
MLGKTQPSQDNDHEYRIEHVYGNRVSSAINSDWINVGVPGGANVDIISKVFDQVIPNISKSYSKITIVLSLTEIGRELPNGLLSLQHQYQILKGPDWPSWDQLVNGEVDRESYNVAMIWMREENIFFRYLMQLHVNLSRAKTVNDLLLCYETTTFDIIQELWSKLNQTRFQLVIGKNFTSIVPEAMCCVSNCIALDHIWCDVIATRGNLSMYPHPVWALSGIGAVSLIEFVEKNSKIKHAKQQLDAFLDSSISALDWLDSSPYNGKIATKHPQEQAHQWWADYLINTISKSL